MNRITLLFSWLLMVMVSVTGYTTTSESYQQNIAVSEGGDISQSESYVQYAGTGYISGVTNAASYSHSLGFLHTWLVADGQACSVDSQCQGGYCCSNACSSSACSTPSPSPGGGGGGGGSGAGRIVPGNKTEPTRELVFSFVEKNLVITVPLGKSIAQRVDLINSGTISVDAQVRLEGLDGVASLPENHVPLEAGKFASFEVVVAGRQVGTYLGQIIVHTEEREEKIPVIVEVTSAVSVLDVTLDILQTHSILQPGDELRAQITLLNSGTQTAEVTITYMIKDVYGMTQYEASEVVEVSEQLSYVKVFPLSHELEAGTYAAIVEARYADSFTVSSQFFTMQEEGSQKRTIIGWVLLTTAVGILGGYVVLMRYLAHQKPQKTKRTLVSERYLKRNSRKRR